MGVRVGGIWSRSHSGVRAKQSGEIYIYKKVIAMRVEKDFEHGETSENSVSVLF